MSLGTILTGLSLLCRLLGLVSWAERMQAMAMGRSQQRMADTQKALKDVEKTKAVETAIAGWTDWSARVRNKYRRD